jgi:hypothetical protein
MDIEYSLEEKALSQQLQEALAEIDVDVSDFMDIDIKISVDHIAILQSIGK